IQNLYLKKHATNCLKVINDWAPPKNIETWVYIKKLKCISLLSNKNKISEYQKNITYPHIWNLKASSKKELKKEFKKAVYFLIKTFLKNKQENKVFTLLKSIDSAKIFLSNREKSYLFYIKARVFYNKKKFLLANGFLNNSFYYHNKASLSFKYPFSLSAFESRSFRSFFKNKKSIKLKKHISYFQQESKEFKKLINMSKKSKYFFDEHVKYLQAYPGSKRSNKINKRLLFAYLSLKKNKQKSFKVLSKISTLRCKFLNKWVGKLFYKSGYKAIDEIYTNQNTKACHWDGDNYFRIAAAYYYQENYDAAEILFKKLPRLYSGHKIVPRSMLFLSFLYIKKNQYKSAIISLKKLLKIRKTDFHLQAYYFLYFLNKKQNNLSSAKFYYKKLLKKYPLTYYSLKLRLLDKSLPSFFITKAKKRDKWKVHLDKKESKSWDKLKLLLKAGWLKESRAELKLWNLPIFSSGVFVYTYLLSQAHDFLSAIKLLHYLWREDQSIHRKSFLKLLFPHFFKTIVEEYASKNNLEPSLVFSLIRQESAFKVDAQSFANAYGLMQMIISTANEVKKLLGIKNKYVSKTELFKPRTNIRFGSRHLRQLFNAWNGNIALALASYNVGYGNLSKWIKSRGDSFKIEDNTEFLNQIWFDELPWMETSFYVKAILRNQILYKSLYKDIK
ncbi:MAG: lytic transglycosylase domain-containing protein, partial [Bdellovibrionales bacterium]|nr:lytic transglycosylase domain-containing protein [Bdellovibrionales bacterium]